MIFLFCSVYSTCRCPFFFAKLLPGRMVKYRHANRQRTERQLSANQRFGYFINSSVCFLALSPSFRSLLMHEKNLFPASGAERLQKEGKKKQVEQIISLRMGITQIIRKRAGICRVLLTVRKRSDGVSRQGRQCPLQMTIAILSTKRARWCLPSWNALPTTIKKVVMTSVTVGVRIGSRDHRTPLLRKQNVLQNT